MGFCWNWYVLSTGFSIILCQVGKGLLRKQTGSKKKLNGPKSAPLFGKAKRSIPARFRPYEKINILLAMLLCWPSATHLFSDINMFCLGGPVSTNKVYARNAYRVPET